MYKIDALNIANKTTVHKKGKIYRISGYPEDSIEKLEKNLYDGCYNIIYNNNNKTALNMATDKLSVIPQIYINRHRVPYYTKKINQIYNLL